MKTLILTILLTALSGCADPEAGSAGLAGEGEACPLLEVREIPWDLGEEPTSVAIHVCPAGEAECLLFSRQDPKDNHLDCAPEGALEERLSVLQEAAPAEGGGSGWGRRWKLNEEGER